MAIFAINHHNAPIFAVVNSLEQTVYRFVFFLHINKRHTYFVKILYFIIRLHSDKKSIKEHLKSKRQKHKSNAVSFQETESGAIPTLTHQKLSKKPAKDRWQELTIEING